MSDDRVFACHECGTDVQGDVDAEALQGPRESEPQARAPAG